ncbi:SGNH/GDSL hydrolase family protein [Paenibacillus sp. GYB004]|uniref:SGNH/GDSL hydrolase family protein n=1 Tax=Paenibacillus sp. GYB004 TaxID=2994393 RepID=UPI002F96B739
MSFQGMNPAFVVIDDKELRTQLDSMTVVSSSSNLINPSTIIDGYLVSGGALTADTNYFTTEYIPIKNGDVVQYTLDSGMGNNNNPYLYDANKNYIGGASSTATTHRTATISNANAQYMRLSFAKYRLSSAMITINTDYPATFEPYGVDTHLNNVYGLNDLQRTQVTEVASANPLKGKIISLNGDSITSGTPAGYVGGYGKIIADRNGMTYQNVAVAGATIASGTTNSGGGNRHWVSQTIGSMRADSDYVILSGGVNDKSLTTMVNLGTMTNGMTDTYDHTTFIGAMEYMFSQAVARFPGKKIGFVLVHRLWTLTDVFHTTWYPAIVKVCQKWGIPLCDLYATVPSMNLIADLKTNYTTNADGWHPNEQGYRLYYVDKIEAWLKTL